MKNMPENYAKNQRRFTSNSRGTKAGLRVARNTTECYKYLEKPILCLGCGDGLEIESLAKGKNINTDHIIGIEVAEDRVHYAREKKKLNIYQGTIENLPVVLKNNNVEEKKFNIYCAHTLEHSYDQNLAIENIKKICLDTIVIIVPIELRGISANMSHLNPIKDLGSLINKFGINFKVLNMEYRWNNELEGLLVLKRNKVKWPENYKSFKDLTSLM